MGEEGRDGEEGPVSARERKKEEANRFFPITSGMVGNFTPTLSAPRIGAPRIGEVPLEELQKKLEWS
jgi:hypothetical protein